MKTTESQYSFYIAADGKVSLPHLGRQVTGTDASLESNPQLAGWVASEHFTFLSCSLPTRNRAKILKTLPYALEEFLIDDVDACHFTPIISSVAGVATQTHVVAKTKMREWKDLLKALRIEPLGIYPDIYALPHKEKVITAFVGKGRCLARTSDGEGFCGRGELFARMLLGLAKDQNKDIEIISDMGRKLPASLRDCSVTDVGSFEEFLAQAEFPPPEFNAMHGDYAPGVRVHKEEHFSRHVLAWVATFCVALLLAQQPLAIREDEKLLREQQARNAELYRQMFDAEPSDPSQLRGSALAAMDVIAESSAAGETDPIWERVSIVSSVLNNCPSCVVTSFDTKEGSRRINIKLLAKKKDPVQKQSFENLGWRILRWRDKKESLPDKRPPLHALEIIAEERQ